MKNTTALIVGGAGAVGTLFCRLLLASYQHVTVVDLKCDEAKKVAGVEYLQCDINDPSAVKKLRASNLILLTTPEEAAIEFIKSSGKLLLPGQCLIDTMSVKSTVVHHLQEIADNIEVLSINPMFGPSLGFKNQSIAFVEVNNGPISTNFLSMICEAGASVVAFTAEEHDRYTASTQVATHTAILIFGMTLEKMNYNSSLAKPIWTPPHKALLALLARMLSADPEVYRDIQASNPYAEEARQKMGNSLDELNANIMEGYPEQFNQLFEQLKPVLNPHTEVLSELSQSIFEQLNLD